MKNIEVDDELYQFIAANTEQIGEEASDILRRLLGFAPLPGKAASTAPSAEDEVEPTAVGAKTKAKTAQAASKPEVEQKVEQKAEKKAEKKGAKKGAKKAAKKAAAAMVLPAVSEQLAALPLPVLTQQKGVVGRFLYILAVLQQAHPQAFGNIIDIRGRDRLYFSNDQDELRSSGSSTNPKEIGNSGFWVLTNSNTARKKWMLAEASKMLGYSATDAALLGDMLEGKEEAEVKKIKKEMAKKVRLERALKKEKAAKQKAQQNEPSVGLTPNSQKEA